MRLLIVEYINLPIISESCQQLAEMEDDHSDVQNRGYGMRVEFKMDCQKKRACMAHPRIATLEELKVSFVKHLKKERPELVM